MKKLFAFLAALLLVTHQPGMAQQSAYVVSVSPTDATAGTAVTLSIALQQRSAIEQLFLMIRPFGSSLFKRLEMDIDGNQARAAIPAKMVAPPYLEYYLVVETRAGARETYPRSTSGDPYTTPPAQTLRLSIAAPDTAEPQVIFLSPEAETPLLSEDVVISISLLRADSIAVRRVTEIYIDGVNVTRNAIFSDDIVVLVPDNYGVHLSPGVHTVGVRLFTRQGKLHHAAMMKFMVRAEERTRAAAPAPGQFIYSLAMQGEARREQISDSAASYFRGGYQFRGSTGIWNFTSNALLSSDETSTRQPQHRYFFGIATPWADLGYGDAYPAFPDLIISGKRVRGLHSSLHYDIVKVDVTWGQITRAIEGAVYKTFPADSFGVEYLKDSSAVYGRINTQTWGKFSYGTYARNLFAVRPTVGPGDTWQVGLSWLTSSDDVGSIRNGIRPQENVVAGLDFVARFDEKRIEISGQGALSAFNSDIGSGSFTDSYIDSVYPGSASQIKSARDLLSGVITINDNFRPFSLSKLSTGAYELNLGLNYFDNLFKFTYLFHGSDYTSFGQSFVRTDVSGFTVVDRIRLIDNQVFATLGFERLQDNTADTKAATTVSTNFNIAASYFPRLNAPSITLGFSRYANDNGLGVAGRDSLLAISDGTNRFFLQSSYDFQWGARHTATVGVSLSSRNDATVQRNDVRTVSVEVGLNTNYTIPLRTIVSIGTYSNTLAPSAHSTTQKDFNYTMLSVHGSYEMVRDIFSLLLTVGPTFGDYQRTVFDLGSDWHIRRDLSVQTQFSFFRNSGLPNDNILSLRCRYSI